jgi:hypothetical protein
MKNKFTNAQGQVISYNETHNLADVYVPALVDGTGINLKDVPVQIAGNGLHQSSLKRGDNVYIQFNNGSIFQPKILGKSDELYATHTRKDETHLRKGELAVSQELEEGDITSSSSTWLDTTNENIFKYESYRTASGINNVSNKMMDKGQFNNQEVGLYNPKSSSIVKIKDDGEIDIFISTNIGIRVNPSNKTIEILGDVTTKSNNWSVLSNNVEIQAKDKIILKAATIDLQTDSLTKNGESIDV